MMRRPQRGNAVERESWDPPEAAVAAILDATARYHRVEPSIRPTRVFYRCHRKHAWQREAARGVWKYPRETEWRGGHPPRQRDPVVGIFLENGMRLEADVPQCPDCGTKDVSVRVLNSRYSAKVKCNARCTAATGFDCECSCGGKNHGVG